MNDTDGEEQEQEEEDHGEDGDYQDKEDEGEQEDCLKSINTDAQQHSNPNTKQQRIISTPPSKVNSKENQKFKNFTIDTKVESNRCY